MVSFNRTRCRAAAILFLVVASAVGSSSGIVSKIGRTLSTASKVPASIISHISDLRRATSRLTTTGNFKQAVELIGDISENLDKAFAQTARPRVHGRSSFLSAVYDNCFYSLVYTHTPSCKYVCSGCQYTGLYSNSEATTNLKKNKYKKLKKKSFLMIKLKLIGKIPLPWQELSLQAIFIFYYISLEF